MKKMRCLILSGFGLNCDHETAYACELAGAEAVRVHINSLIDKSVSLNDFQLMVFGGGFSWGDDHGAGVIQALRMKTHIGDRMLEFIEQGKLILGICNGFQTLVNIGLLPGLSNNYTKRSVALTYNDCGNFRNHWVTMNVNPQSPCIFTKGFDVLELPIRHGEGKFYASEPILDQLIENHQVTLRYALPNGDLAEGAFPYNPNGSLRDIAGICDPTGRVFGLMPHPEAFIHPLNHPDWARQRENMKRGKQKGFSDVTPGVLLFKNAAEFILHTS